MRKSLLLSVLISSIILSCNKSDDRYDFEWSVSTPVAEGLDQQKIDSAYIKAKELGFVDALKYSLQEYYFRIYMK